jgi:hypothetical protein
MQSTQRLRVLIGIEQLNVAFVLFDVIAHGSGNRIAGS